MSSKPGFIRGGVFGQVVGILALIAILFVSGCTVGGSGGSGGEGQLAVETLSGGLPAGSVSEGGGTYPATTLQASGGTAPYTWAVTAGSSLPPGLNLSAAGVISGGPTAAGAFSFSVTVTDAATPAHTANGSLSITINPKLTITSSVTLPAGEVSAVYAATLTQSGGVGPFTWVVSSGTLPNGLSLSSSGTIGGTISASATPGTFSFTAKVTDSQGNNVVSGTLSITVDSALTITPPAFPLGIVGSAYAAPAFSASGGSGSGYTYAVASGSLPTSLAITPGTGVISGTPTVAGTFTFAVKVTDSLGLSATAGNLSITINGALAIKAPTFPAGIVGASYPAETFTASGGSGTGYTFTLASGSLPNPLTLGANGTIASAVPTAAGTSTFTVKVTDSLSNTATTASLSITIDPTLVITPPSFPAGIVGASYPAETFTASGGSGTGYTFALASGSLPAPLTLGANGTIASATPTAAGTFTFTAKVTDSLGFTATSGSLSITIAPALVITAPTFPTGVLGVSYPAKTFTASGGSGTGYTFALASGSLPNPMILGAGGTIASAVPTLAGTSTFTVKVTDSLGNTATTGSLSIIINGPLAISAPTFPTGVVGASYAAETFTASGGSGAGYTFTLASGALPNPLTLGTNGTIASATPTAAGTFTFTVTVTDSLDDTATTGSLSITIDPALVITPPTFPTGIVGVSYPAETFTATGGSGTGYTFTLASGSLPAPLVLGTNGTIASATPTTAGTFTFTVKVTDSLGFTATSSSLSIKINTALAIIAPAFPTGAVGASYPAETFTATGGSGTGYTFTLASGALPNPLTLGANGTIASAIPTASGTFTFTVKVTDSLSETATSGSLSITIDPALVITPPTFPTGIVGASYPAETFTASGGSGSGYTFALASGSLPNPLTLGANGTIASAVPTAAGTSTFTVKVTDSLGNTATSGSLSITIDPGLVITPPSFPNGVVGVSYPAKTFTASGGSGTGYTFTLASGSLPNPLTLGANGTIASAVPTASGTSTFTVKVTDSLGNTATTGTLSITINGALTITPPTFPTGVVGASYPAETFTASGGSGTGYTFTLASGSLPTPLALGANGTIASAVPAAAGTSTFTVTVTDSLADTATTGSLSITIDPSLVITPPTFPAGTVGTSYPAETFTASGGSGTGYTFTLASGSLPNPLTLGTNGTIASATPTAAGTFTFTVKVTDSLGFTAISGSLSIKINPALTITPPSFPSGVVGVAYPAETFTATGGSGAGYTFTLASGSLPNPLTLGANGTIASAVPTAAGTSTFIVKVTDSLGNTATTGTLSITINLSLVITPPTFPTGVIGASYPAETFTASGGSGTGYTFTLASGSLPTPLTLGTNGTIASATPTVSGTFTFTVKVTDSASNTATSGSLSIVIDPTLIITPPSFPIGVVGVSYPAETFTASGGSGTGYTFTLASGSLPNPLTLGTNGTIASAVPTASGTSTFTVKVTDSLGNTATTGTLSITINGALTITPPSFPTGIVGASYGAKTFTASGGSGTGYTFTLASGSLPTPLVLGTNGTIAAATPTAAGTFTFTVKVTDSLSDTATTSSLSITIDPALVITPPTFPTGSLGVSYPAEAFTASGGSGTGYTFTLASGSLPNPLALGTNGTIASATPTVSGTFTFTVKVTDSLGFTATTGSLSITITGASCTNCTISGTVTGPWVQDVTITLSGAGTATTTTNASGQYSFASLTAGGTYTVTPTLAGYTYSPAAPVIVLDSDTTQNFSATSDLTSYSISGTVSYAGSHTGNTIIRVFPNGCTNCGVMAGTSISSAPSAGGTAYTITGLAPVGGGENANGSYVLTAEIDTLGTGVTNESNPEGTSGTVTINSANVTGVDITLVDRTPSAAQTPTQFSVAPNNTVALVQYKGPQDSNGEEIATSYKVYYGTDTNASNGAGSPKTFKAHGQGSNVLILSGLANGATYFKMSSVNGGGESATTAIIGPLTLAAGTGADTVSGTVTFPTGTTFTGPLYVGVYSNSGSGIYVERIASPTNPQAYSISGVPSGSYQNFGIVDQNNDGEIDAGDISNVNSQINPPTLVVSGNTTGNITLTNPTAQISIPTSVFGSSGQPNSYSLNLNVNTGSKLPISMIMFSGKNVAVPYDMNADTHNAQYSPIYANSISPTAGDTYQILVTFSDASTQIVPVSLSAVLNSFPQNLEMNSPVANTATVPVLNWTAPATLPTILPYSYSVNLNSNNGTPQENWNYSGPGNGNGIPSTQTNVQFDVDGSANPSSSLTPGGSYNWSVTVQDNANNQAQYSTTYTVPGGAVQSPVVTVSFNPTSIAVGGNATLVFFIQNPNGATSLTGIALSDTLPSGLTVLGSAFSNSCGGTFTGTGAGSTSLSLSGVTVAAGASCQTGVQVTAGTAGTYNDQTGNVTSNEGGTGAMSNTASLVVGGTGILPPTISISFNPNAIQVDFSTTLFFNISNPNSSSSLSGIDFTDNLPSNLFVLSPNNGISGSCGSGTITAVAGSASISLSGGTIAAAGNCSFSVNVTATAAGTINDVTGAISSNEGGTGGTSNVAPLTVNNPTPATCSGAPSGQESVLSGRWVVLVQGWQGTGPGTPTASVFNFSANGAGAFNDVTGSGVTGDIDSNNAANGANSVFTSTLLTAGSSYAVGLDPTNGTGYVGCMTLANSGATGVSASSVVLRFTLSVPSGTAVHGHIIQWTDNSGNGSGVRVAGVMLPQDATAFSGGTLANLKSNYAFGEDGLDTSSDHFAIAGTFSLNTTTGHATATYDLDDAGSVASQQSESPTISNLSSTTGRALFTATPEGASAATHTALYIVNANEFFLVGIDPYSTTALASGRAVATGTTFSTSSLSGNYVIYVTSSGGIADMGLGVLSLSNGAINNTSTLYSYEAGSAPEVVNPSGSYTVATSGRMTLGAGGPVIYLATPQSNTEPITGFIVGTDSSASAGELQVGANSNVSVSTMAGNYIFGNINPGDSTVNDQCGVANLDSSGDVSGYQFRSTLSGLSANALNSGGGSPTVAITNSPLPGFGSVGSGTIAISNGTRIWFIDTGDSNNSPASINVIEP
jgi:hypothetical protein